MTGLKHRKDFEDILRSHGTSFKAPERPCTVLGNDIRLRPNYDFSPEEAREIQSKAIQRRAYWDSVKMAASAQGVPLHQMAAAKSFYAPREREPILGNHNELYQREQSVWEFDAQLRDEQIMANIAESERQMAEALNQRPRSITEQIAEAAEQAAGGAGALGGGSGVRSDAARFLAGNAAKASVYAASGTAQASGSVLSKAAKLGAMALGFEDTVGGEEARHGRSEI